MIKNKVFQCSLKVLFPQNCRIYYKITVIKSKKDNTAFSICSVSDSFIIESFNGEFEIVSDTPDVLHILPCECEQLRVCLNLLLALLKKSLIRIARLYLSFFEK